MYFVYALYNLKRDKIYIGYTSNLENRLARHNGLLKNKKSSFTSRNDGDWRLIYKEILPNKQMATKREKELKSCQGRKFVRRYLNNSGA